jgi:hypothetical protein
LTKVGHGVALADSLFPMFNATWIAALLYLWRPRLESVPSSGVSSWN